MDTNRVRPPAVTNCQVVWNYITSYDQWWPSIAFTCFDEMEKFGLQSSVEQIILETQFVDIPEDKLIFRRLGSNVTVMKDNTQTYVLPYEANYERLSKAVPKDMDLKHEFLAGLEEANRLIRLSKEDPKATPIRQLPFGRNGSTGNTGDQIQGKDKLTSKQKWKAVARDLKASGWTEWKGPQKTIYFRPGISPGEGILGRDFFHGEEQVLRYLARMESKDDDRLPQIDRLSERKRNQALHSPHHPEEVRSESPTGSDAAAVNQALPSAINTGACDQKQNLLMAPESIANVVVATLSTFANALLRMDQQVGAGVGSSAFANPQALQSLTAILAANALPVSTGTVGGLADLMRGLGSKSTDKVLLEKASDGAAAFQSDSRTEGSSSVGLATGLSGKDMSSSMADVATKTSSGSDATKIPLGGMATTSSVEENRNPNRVGSVGVGHNLKEAVALQSAKRAPSRQHLADIEEKGFDTIKTKSTPRTNGETERAAGQKSGQSPESQVTPVTKVGVELLNSAISDKTLTSDDVETEVEDASNTEKSDVFGMSRANAGIFQPDLTPNSELSFEEAWKSLKRHGWRRKNGLYLRPVNAVESRAYIEGHSAFRTQAEVMQVAASENLLGVWNKTCPITPKLNRIPAMSRENQQIPTKAMASKVNKVQTEKTKKPKPFIPTVEELEQAQRRLRGRPQWWHACWKALSAAGWSFNGRYTRPRGQDSKRTRRTLGVDVFESQQHVVAFLLSRGELPDLPDDGMANDSDTDGSDLGPADGEINIVNKEAAIAVKSSDKPIITAPKSKTANSSRVGPSLKANKTDTSSAGKKLSPEKSEGPECHPFSLLWQELQQLGWKWSAGMYRAPRPRSEFGQKYVAGVNMFNSEREVMDYLNANPSVMARLSCHIPLRPTINPKRTDSIAHRSPMPKQSHTPTPRGKKVDDLYLTNWQSIWVTLKSEGWVFRKGSALYSSCFLRPGKDVKNGTPGVDYFYAKEEVLQYLKEQGRQFDTLFPATDSLSVRMSGKGRTGLSESCEAGYSCRPECESEEEASAVSEAADAGASSGTEDVLTEETLLERIFIGPDEVDLKQWQKIWDHLREQGWKWCHGSGVISTFRYRKPGTLIKTGRKGIDWFDTQAEVVRSLAKTKELFPIFGLSCTASEPPPLVVSTSRSVETPQEATADGKETMSPEKAYGESNLSSRGLGFSSGHYRITCDDGAPIFSSPRKSSPTKARLPKNFLFYAEEVSKVESKTLLRVSETHGYGKHCWILASDSKGEVTVEPDNSQEDLVLESDVASEPSPHTAKRVQFELASPLPEGTSKRKRKESELGNEETPARDLKRPTVEPSMVGVSPLDKNPGLNISVAETLKRSLPTTQFQDKSAAITTMGLLESCFLPSGKPPRLVSRDAERRFIHEFLDRCIAGGPGSSLYIFGAPGTGKSATVAHCLAKIDGVKVKSVMINAGSVGDDSQYLVSTIVKELFNYKSEDGDPLDYLTSRVQQNDKETCWVIVVDEIENCLHNNVTQTMIYNLFALSHREDTSMVLIGISNSAELKQSPFPALPWRNCEPCQLQFKAYSKEELHDLLKARVAYAAAKLGVVDDSRLVDPEALELCARTVSANSGGMRKALEVCSQAVKEAATSLRDRDGDIEAVPAPLITLHSMKRALQNLSSLSLREAVNALPFRSKVVLCAVLLLVSEVAKPIAWSKLFEQYAMCSQQVLRTSLARPPPSQFNDLVDLLAEKGFLRTVSEKVYSPSGRSEAAIVLTANVEDLKAILAKEKGLNAILAAENL